MRSSQLNRVQKKMGMVGTTRHFRPHSPPNPLILLTLPARKKKNRPLTAQVGLMQGTTGTSVENDPRLPICCQSIGVRSGLYLDRSGYAGDETNAIGNLLDPDAHRHALGQPHPGEDRVDGGQPLLVGLRI